MKLFADTGDLRELGELEEMGLISGATTNPSLLSAQGKDAVNSLKKIRQFLPDDYPVFAQVATPDVSGMVDQGERIHAAGCNMVVKIPATNNGLKAIAALKKKGIRTCATAILTSAEALLCAVAGASYVAPYTGQNEVIGYSGYQTLKEIADMLALSSLGAEIVAASIDKPQDIVETALAGAHIATLTYDQLRAVCDKPAPLTDYYIGRFMDDWNDVGAYFS